ncbi:MAG: alanine acetyltransferase [Thalassospira sp.]|uniref:GNAT family N-acetyltransferase n=1 Tax=Thalassospira sp. UBA4513 TaxID=1947675 RepID=UPI000C575A43|nr:GNAT family N-acetyltransferase [Thalassospira sp. UBA4513]MBE71816.1 alanine acetyltransferase [Thalassospira sp.]|tara:strand:+ start:206 stop:715 length:510 start_codon:yes stop_codon:yes gene_type:complete
MIVQTERTILREATHDDAPFILQLLNEPGWLRFIGDRNIHDLQAARDYIDLRFRENYDKLGFGMCVALEKQGQSPIGLIGFVKRDTLDAPDIGYAVTEAHQGKGYAYEVSSALINHGWHHYGFDKIYGYCLPENVASVRMLEKLGLTYLRDQDVNHSGEMCRLYMAPRP